MAACDLYRCVIELVVGCIMAVSGILITVRKWSFQLDIFGYFNDTTTRTILAFVMIWTGTLMLCYSVRWLRLISSQEMKEVPLVLHTSRSRAVQSTLGGTVCALPTKCPKSGLPGGPIFVLPTCPEEVGEDLISLESPSSIAVSPGNLGVEFRLGCRLKSSSYMSIFEDPCDVSVDSTAPSVPETIAAIWDSPPHQHPLWRNCDDCCGRKR